VLRDILAGMCGDLEKLTGRINQLTAQITQRITELCPTLLARPGVGPITAATILGELGDPTRVRSCAAFARLAGTAPIPIWTSDRERRRLDPGGNRKINSAIHMVARTQARSHPDAQQLLAKHRTRGKKHALRVLKRHLTDAIWRDINTDLTNLTRHVATT
jgi:transposase